MNLGRRGSYGRVEVRQVHRWIKEVAREKSLVGKCGGCGQRAHCAEEFASRHAISHAFSFFHSTLTEGPRHTSRVAVRVFAAPFPRAAYDGLELRKLRLPVQITLDAFRAGHQNRRITRAPRLLTCRDRMPSYAANSLDHFANAKA